MERWAEDYENNPALFDTSHGTNKYFLKFGALTTVDRSGRTVILASSLISIETQSSFEWVFREFVKAFHTPPKVLFTDGNPAMAAAIRCSLPNTSHLLCTYHLSKNLYTHIRPLFNHKHGNAKLMWNTFCNLWWKICKKQDSDSCNSFDEEWHNLLAILDSIEQWFSIGSGTSREYLYLFLVENGSKVELNY